MISIGEEFITGTWQYCLLGLFLMGLVFVGVFVARKLAHGSLEYAAWTLGDEWHWWTSRLLPGQRHERGQLKHMQAQVDDAEARAHLQAEIEKLQARLTELGQKPKL